MAGKIEKMDSNFRKAELRGGFLYQDVSCYPAIVIDGVFPGTFCRMDPSVLDRMSEGVRGGAWHTAGACIRFRVTGGKFAVRMLLRDGNDMAHMPRGGIGGAAIYTGIGQDRIFCNCCRPATSGAKEVTGEVTLPSGEEEVTMYLPLYDGVETLELGFPEGVTPEAPAPYAIELPVVFYGSSITQGGCASQPGNCYTNMISRMLDCKTWNLGFSGNAKGEPEMAEYIAGMPMSVFVMDYDHNAPSVEHLERTHLPFLKTILEKQPNLPVVMVSKPDFYNGNRVDNERRREIILKSFLWAREHGYKVEFVDGRTLFDGPLSRDCTVDGCHPNDLGFARMALKILPAIKRVLED